MSGEEVLVGLLDLARRARHARSLPELEFMAVNDSHALAPFRQAALWFPSGVACLSGVVQIEANAPYVQWLSGVFEHLVTQEEPSPRRVSAADAPDTLRDQWQAWLPAHGLLITHRPATGSPAEYALLLARDLAWSEHEIHVLGEWMDIWCHARKALQPQGAGWFRQKVLGALSPRAGGPWWRRRGVIAAAVAAAVLLCPVRLTVLAPGELVPARPAVVRAPLDGVIETVHVQPNQDVRKDQPLFDFDEALIRSRLDVAQQGLATAEAEYRQTVQQALTDEQSKTQISVLRGKIEERRSEASFLEEQITRAHVLSPRDGVVLFDDPSEWTGRPVKLGERVMRIASLGESEVEAWIPVADAIPLETGARVSLYLNASPVDPVEATIRYVAHDAVQRPDGSYAYRMRASLSAPTEHRVGSKGTAKLRGGWVVFSYWMLRRPLAGLRTTLGW